MLAHNGDRGERLERGHVATAGHDNVRRNAALVVTDSLPNAHALRAVLNRSRQLLRRQTCEASR